MASPLQTANAFVELINAQNVLGILESVTDGSRFFVEGEDPTVGREQLRDAWAGYFKAFPNYVIFIDECHERNDAVYFVGHTEGSHVPEEVERAPSSVIWRCAVVGSRVSEWSIYPASEENRGRFGLGASAA